MGKIVAVVNQKGGVGKTTTVINLAAALVEQNYKVLIVDIDPQGNATSGCGILKNQVQSTIYDVLVNNEPIKTVIKQAQQENIDVVPSNMNLAGTEVELVNTKQREFILKTQLDSLKKDYDYIFIDCPPAVNILTINALTASSSVLIPMQCEYYALEGLSQLVQTIGLVKKNTNPKLVLEGILFTMYDSRTNLSFQVVKEVQNHFRSIIYNTKITRSVRLSEAPSFGMSCISYDAKSKGTEQYRQLAMEFIERNQ
ncbi:ParA family protein [Cellulosilyticum sp. I15G10I2]|uniref:ParA family protein n=1 Tax=Cellulosilyticum sp. I15G10I2 TaxID=1892843 RepID=UPI00085C298C|nr:AAA family ATPase [Cellulosilyticum sp. I15G10I2]